jgi:hypothetical protein
MIKNTANQYITFGAIAVADGLPVTTGTPTVYLSKDGGAQATSSNTATHVGNGLWQLALTQSETNADHLGAVLVLANAVNAFSQVYPLTLSDFKSDATAANQTSISNAIAGLNDFDPAADAVANVTTVQTCVSNSDMRGTDGANTVAPDNTGIAAIEAVTDKLDTALVVDGSVYQYTANALENAPTGGGGDATLAKQNQIISDIAALNDFDPSSDTVANVTLVGTCTTNSDMRGTDNANTIAPDNAGITSNGTAIASNGNGIASNGNAIAALNDITASDVFNQLVSGSYASGSFGERLLVGSNTNRECQITGSNHIAADVHEIQTDVIDADSIAASAVTELQTDLIKVGATHTHTNQAGDTMQVTIT